MVYTGVYLLPVQDGKILTNIHHRQNKVKHFAPQ